MQLGSDATSSGYDSHCDESPRANPEITLEALVAIYSVCTRHGLGGFSTGLGKPGRSGARYLPVSSDNRQVTRAIYLRASQVNSLLSAMLLTLPWWPTVITQLYQSHDLESNHGPDCGLFDCQVDI